MFQNTRFEHRPLLRAASEVGSTPVDSDRGPGQPRSPVRAREGHEVGHLLEHGTPAPGDQHDAASAGTDELYRTPCFPIKTMASAPGRHRARPRDPVQAVPGSPGSPPRGTP